MKNYFIDFEATQFTHEIISVGCVSEDGETFDSYVYVYPSKITNFITSLTGITKEMNEKAPYSDEVFRKFFDWLIETNLCKEPVRFYCYGNCDKTFVEKQLKCTNNIFAQMALSLVASNLIDYSPSVKHHFGLVKNISLNKVVAYYEGVEEIQQKHNALDDAEYLREVYYHVLLEERVTSHPFPTYEMHFEDIKDNETAKMRKRLNETPHFIEVRNDDEYLIKNFGHIGSALEWVKANFHSGGETRKFDAKQAANKIINANRKNKKYCGFYWDITFKENADENMA